jgi:2-polyprenyl-3-methyl-5-hydroxy-6-metoxy-1,4-benzoquinol methylase
MRRALVRARELAREGGVADRVTFQRASAKEFRGTYDLVAFFDCLHDMGDPVGVAAHVRSTLKPGGTWMIVGIGKHRVS